MTHYKKKLDINKLLFHNIYLPSWHCSCVRFFPLKVAPINDDGDFYVTQWLPDLDLGDWRYRSTLKTLKKVAYMVLGQPLGLKWTRIYHCKSADGACHAVGPSAASWNGITHIPPRGPRRGSEDDGLGHIVAVDAMAKKLAVFRVALGGSLVLERRVALANFVDNVRWVPEEQRVWGAGMAIAGQCYFGCVFSLPL